MKISTNNQYNQKLIFYQTSSMDKSLKFDVGKKYFLEMGYFTYKLEDTMKWLIPEETKLLKLIQEQLWNDIVLLCIFYWKGIWSSEAKWFALGHKANNWQTVNVSFKLFLLYQLFSAGGNFATLLGEHLTMSADILVVTITGFFYNAQVTQYLTAKNYPSPNVNSAEIEKPYSTPWIQS